MPTTPATRIVANTDSAERPLAGPGRAPDALTDRREDVQEDEHQQERLHEGPGDELADVLAEHGQVAQEQRPEGLAAGDRGRTGLGDDVLTGALGGDGRGHQSRRSFPVRLMKTVSSEGSATERSATE